MAKVRMGYEGQIFRGTAGSTASTQITALVTDIEVSTNIETATTTDRGDGTTLPIITEDAVAAGQEITFTMLNKDSDASIAAFRAAIEPSTHTPIALRLKDWSSGVGFDGDVTLSFNHSKGLGDRQELSFTAKPTKQSARSYTFFA